MNFKKWWATFLIVAGLFLSFSANAQSVKVDTMSGFNIPFEYDEVVHIEGRGKGLKNANFYMLKGSNICSVKFYPPSKGEENKLGSYVLTTLKWTYGDLVYTFSSKKDATFSLFAKARYVEMLKKATTIVIGDEVYKIKISSKTKFDLTQIE